MAASAPLFESTDSVPGYEEVVGTNQIILQPKHINEPILPIDENRTFQDIPYLSEDEAKNALENYVDSKCCYGKCPVKGMVYTNLESSNTFRYLLETFTETRSTAWVSEPYSGQPLYNTGSPPPAAWDIEYNPSCVFVNAEAKMEIPGTARVDRCLPCNYMGYRICHTCRGSGRSHCSTCDGSGHSHTGRCTWCKGTGFRSCMHCHGVGRLTCHACNGRGTVKWYIQLTITYKNNTSDFIKKSSENIPDDLFRTCSGKIIFTEENIRLSPITNYSDEDINRASANLIQSHSSRLTNCRILRQRQSIIAIPITVCYYSYQKNAYKYYVYGLNKQVYHPDYPATCCCCTIS